MVGSGCWLTVMSTLTSPERVRGEKLLVSLESHKGSVIGRLGAAHSKEGIDSKDKSSWSDY